jgi:hypothetical protein
MSFLSKYISPLLYKDTDCSKVTNVLLVDHYVQGYETVVKSANDSTFAIGYFMKSQRSELLALLRRKFTKIQRIGLFFESSLENPKSFLQLQSLFRNNETSPYSPNVQFLIELIKEFKVTNIDFLACNTLLYPNWVNYFSILQSETGVIIGASNDATGNLKYGGDWVLESTQQNIEKTYFNKSIEYYQYVLDNQGWAGVFNGPTDVAVSGQYMYVTNYFDGNTDTPGTTISRIDLTDTNNPDICFNWLSGFEYPFSLAIDGNNLFVSNSDSIDNGGGENNISYISKVNVNTLDVSYHWLDLYGEFVVYTGINTGITVDTNHYLYINDVSNSNIIKVNTQNVSDICYNWLTGDMISPPLFSIVHGDYLYATNISNGNCEGFLSRTKLSDGSTIAPWGDFFGFASFGIAISGNYIYISNLCGNTIYVLNLSDGTFVPESENWSNNISNEVGLPFNNRIYNNQLYVMEADSGYIGQYDLFVPASYVSCLLEGTMVWTLGGYVAIESLKVGDSIRTKNYSIAITKVGKWKVDLNSEKDRSDLSKKMYKIPAGRFGATSDTFISHYHRILYYTDDDNSSRGYDIPTHLGLEVASPVEFAVDGKYTLYHLQLAIGNHFVVNGGCMVEAWNPENVLV